MSACLREPKPANFYINESLTTKRLKLLRTIRTLRADHRDLFKQCYTQNGEIIVQLVSQHKQNIQFTISEHCINSSIQVQL